MVTYLFTLLKHCMKELRPPPRTKHGISVFEYHIASRMGSCLVCYILLYIYSLIARCDKDQDASLDTLNPKHFHGLQKGLDALKGGTRWS